MSSNPQRQKLENRNSKIATPQQPKLESRNSKIVTAGSIFEFRFSNFDLRFQISNFKFQALRLPLLLALSLGLGGWLHPAYGATRVWERSVALPPGGHISVANIRGSVWVEGWDRSVVEATVAISSETPTDQLDDVQVAVATRSGAVAFHTYYPAGLDVPIRVDYRLRVPRQVRLDDLSTLEGDIVVHGVEGLMFAHNLHGNIEGIDVSGSVVAHALAGNILVSLHALPDRRLPVELATINGNVDLLLPAEANANLELSAVAGNILGDYAFQASSVPGDSTRRAQVGAGGMRVALQTLKGNIRVGQRDGDL